MDSLLFGGYSLDGPHKTALVVDLLAGLILGTVAGKLILLNSDKKEVNSL
jgi:hypothetical protein